MVKSLAGVSWVVGAYTLSRVGVAHAAFFQVAQGHALTRADLWGLWASGLWYTLPVLAIIGAHELGHWVAAHHYRMRTVGPFFLPWPLAWSMPWLHALGTAGAFLRIQSPRPLPPVAQFDIASAGLFTGVAATLVATGVGVVWSVPLPGHVAGSQWTPGPIDWLLNGPAAWHPLLFAARVGWIMTTASVVTDGWEMIPVLSEVWGVRKWAIVAVCGVCTCCLV